MRDSGASFTLPPSGAAGGLLAFRHHLPRDLLALGVEHRGELRLDEAAEQLRHRRRYASSLISLRLEPRLLRIFCQKREASMSCTLPLRCAGLRLETIQT